MNSNQQVHYNMVETTKPAKMMEATQFTKEEYDKAKSENFAVVNEFKKNAMLKLAGMEKDPKSDLNVIQGGIKNVRRIRVLKNSSILGEASWDQKNISLVLDLLSAAKNVPVRPTASKSETPPAKQFLVYIEALGRLGAILDQLVTMSKEREYPEGFITEFEACKKLLDGANKESFVEIRTRITTLLVHAPRETTPQQQYFSLLEYVPSLAHVCSAESGPASATAIAAMVLKTVGFRTQGPTRPSNGQKNKKPQQKRPVVQNKPAPQN